MLRRVLVATDFSMHAKQALLRAAKLPLARGARIDLVHVVVDDQPGSTTRRHAQSALDLQREALVASVDPSLRVTASIAAGSPWMEIVRAARLHGAELVVIGAHSKRGRLFPLGSIARDIVRRGSSPVLVVRSPATRRYRRPLVAVDLSDVSRCVVDTALLIVEDDVPIRVVHAYHVPFEGYVATSSSRAELLSFRRHYRDEARERLAGLIASLEARSARCEASIRRGGAYGVIVREIATKSPDLLVVGTHGRTGLSHYILGSVAQSLLDHASCDVLVGRPERFPIASD